MAANFSTRKHVLQSGAMIGLLDQALRTADPDSTEEPTVAIEAGKTLVTLLKPYSKCPMLQLTIICLCRCESGRRVPVHSLPRRERAQAGKGT